MTFATILNYFCSLNKIGQMTPEKPLTYLLGQTVNMVKHKLISKFKANGIDINLETFTLLHFIHQNDNQTQQDMANHFMRDKSIILRQVNTLIEHQYVTRISDKSDKRKKILMLTPKGTAMLQDLKKLSGEVSNELLHGITTKELQQFESIIDKIQNNTGYENCLSNN